MRKEFNNQLNDLRWQAIKMGDAAQQALDNALHSIERGDKELAQHVVQDDCAINQRERDIESACLKIMLTQQPVAQDMMLVSGVLCLVSDIERIGDQAANIAEIAAKFEEPLEEHYAQALLMMGRHANQMVSKAVSSLLEQDTLGAKSVIEADETVDEDFRTVKQLVVDGFAADAATAGGLFDVAMIAKYLERIGDHAVNIAEYVGYMQTGEYKGTIII